MAALNFPINPAVDDTFIANNVIYTWTGVYWEANATNGFDARYVNVTGDNMTGNLTLGTDKITLNAADGSITAAGAIKAPKMESLSGTGVVYGYQLNHNQPGGGTYERGILTLRGVATNSANQSAIRVIREGDTHENMTVAYDGSITAAGDVKIGGTLPSSPNISLNSDGTINALGQIYANAYNLSSNTVGDNDVKYGIIAASKHDNTDNYSSVFARNYNVNGRVWCGVQPGGTIGSEIFADGSATFAGDVLIGGTLPSSPKISLNAADGSITAAGKGEIGSSTETGTIFKVRGQGTSTGEYNIACYSDSGTVFSVARSGSIGCGGLGSAAPAYIAADGSATFAGTIQTADQLFVGYASFPNVKIRKDGYLNGYKADGTSSWTLASNGAAVFQGTVTATVVPPSDARFKENITPAKPQLADVVALGGLLKNYEWNADAPVNDELRKQRQLGLIAQEAETVCPGLVKTIKRTKQGKELTPEVTDVKGNVTAEATYEELDDNYKGLSTDVIIMKLLGAVAELKAEVDALKKA